MVPLSSVPKIVSLLVIFPFDDMRTNSNHPIYILGWCILHVVLREYMYVLLNIYSAITSRYNPEVDNKSYN